MLCTCCFQICSPIGNTQNRVVWCWRISENFWHSITPGVIYRNIRIQWMQLGDPTRVHFKNNFQNTIAKVNSSQFLVLDNAFRGQRTYFMCIYSTPKMCNYSWCFHMDCIPSIVFIPGHRFLESLRHNISSTRSQVVEIHTNNKWYLRHRHERVNHSKEFKNGEHLRWKREYVYFVDNERIRYKHYCTSNRSNLFKYSQIVAVQIVLSQILFAANGFHQNNAENVHSVAKRDARKVQHMVFYCNLLYFHFL